MSGRMEDFESDHTERDMVSVVEQNIWGEGQLFGLIGMRCHRNVQLVLDFAEGARMIEMAVRNQNVGRICSLQFLEDLRRFTRDVDQNAILSGFADKDVGICSVGGCFDLVD